MLKMITKEEAYALAKKRGMFTTFKKSGSSIKFYTMTEDGDMQNSIIKDTEIDVSTTKANNLFALFYEIAKNARDFSRVDELARF